MDKEAVLQQVLTADREMQPESRILFHLAAGIALGVLETEWSQPRGGKLEMFAVDKFIIPLLELADPGDRPLMIGALRKLVAVWSSD